MEKMNHKSKSIHDILPIDLIHIILLRVPIRHVARLKCVSKLWCSLISDPDFAELHFRHSPAATKIFLKNGGFSKRISYSHIVRRLKYHGFGLSYSRNLHGFGYDASQDDYLFVVAYRDYERQEDYLECLSLRTNSWINLDAVLPSPLDWFDHNSRGLFLNGAIHWVPFCLEDYRDAILIFDLKEKTFSRISAPEQLLIGECPFPCLALLGDCLSLYCDNYGSHTTQIWVMKEYKVHSSWTLCQIPCKAFQPLCLSSNGDIIGKCHAFSDKRGYLIYNVRGDLLKHFKNLYCPIREADAVYTESLLSLPSNIKDKDKKRKRKKICM
ncbi:F-box/kelch-repeat protein At3g06240-like [Arachis ipaensis]|uniref:F-box/kelch-repeat protein At3g06240-like n=1 Tax=Arachis ipaensis TaxID=130454 RepID=UPI0007AEE9C2|nr:F-box/kelch-repeat protein At3g06240-like [Arachis ipaensis]XP_025664132.1 F-box/kelch-repeat protein At3g06240-like [Arachis hypogaea]QHN93940.1 F-box protein [Arachis hypogaea]